MTIVDPPVPLTDPLGRVCLYLCPRCYQASHPYALLIQLDGPSPSLVDSSRLDADRCCRCSRCRAPLSERSRGPCALCKPEADAEQEERYARIAVADAAEDAAREQSLAAANDRDAALRLVQVMRDISEECWCAGWLMGLEYSLWEVLQSGPSEFGMGEIGHVCLAELRRLHEKAGGWWRWDDEAGGEMFVPTKEWEELYANRGG